jgi:hypothetical protein
LPPLNQFSLVSPQRVLDIVSSTGTSSAPLALIWVRSITRRTNRPFLGIEVAGRLLLHVHKRSLGSIDATNRSIPSGPPAAQSAANARIMSSENLS